MNIAKGSEVWGDFRNSIFLVRISPRTDAVTPVPLHRMPRAQRCSGPSIGQLSGEAVHLIALPQVDHLVVGQWVHYPFVQCSVSDKVARPTGEADSCGYALCGNATFIQIMDRMAFNFVHAVLSHDI